MRLRVVIRGGVQGVGFRPFVYRLATQLGLSGWVNNSPQGVCVEVEGEGELLHQFLIRIQAESPPRSRIQSLEPAWLDPVGYQGFEIRPSVASGEKSVLVLPDIATCHECLQEILDPADRRHRYPFTNCVHCGPRFSLIEALPYDRPHTSMKGFALCDECRAEYEDPANRRFHAQPNACPQCGPQLAWWDETGRELATCDAALRLASKAIVEGAIVAVKGLGGFHLMCLAADEEAIGRLRERKHREEKPFAVMFPSVQSIHEQCEVSPLEERLLRSPEAPIVLLQWKSASGQRPAEISPQVAPGHPGLGAMFPYTPLHHLLLRGIGRPVVATSGNLSDEPICTEEREVVRRLGGIADYFLVHDRPIVRHVDDSIVRVVAGREMMLRRARGYAPLPFRLKSEVRIPQSEVVLAVGAHLKNAVALSVGEQVFVSQHIGDLETEAAFAAFHRVTGDLQRLYGVTATRVVADAHPDYLSTQFAQQSGRPWTQVQHHVAHVLSCMTDNELDAPVLGVAWDGTGLGEDGTVWGGEFIQITRSGAGLEWRRVAHLRPFRLPGGEVAVKEPRRCALSLLYELYGESLGEEEDSPARLAFQPAEREALVQMLQRAVNSPRTSSMGRMFDAVAALTGLRQRVRHEGQAAMALEFAAEGVETEEAYPVRIARRQTPGAHGQPPLVDEGQASAAAVLDWQPWIECLLSDVRAGIPAGLISARFHNTLAEAIVALARRTGIEQVALSGGCFQNRRLLERTVERLQQEGFRPYWHQRVPPNDGGIALGQVAACRENLSSSFSGSSPDCARD